MSNRENDGRLKEEADVNPRGRDNAGGKDLFAEVLRSIGVLQTVREPGRGKLSMPEAIDAAFSQGGAFKGWSASGAPVGCLEVWVEERRVMTVMPQPPANLKDFTFEVASPDDAVLQLVRAERKYGHVVLINLPLRGVPAAGKSHTETMPNGQRITLDIRPEEPGKFHIKVAFTPLADELRLPAADDEPQTPDGERAMGTSARIRSALGRWRWSATAWAYASALPRLDSRITATVTVLCLLLTVVANAGRLGTRIGHAVAAPEAAERRGTRPSTAAAGETTAARACESDGCAPDETVAASSPVLTPSPSPATPPPPTVTASLRHRHGGRSDRAHGPAARPAGSASNDPSPPRDLAHAGGPAARPTAAAADTAWDTRRHGQLASVRYVYVKLDAADGLGVSPQEESLRAAFLRELKGVASLSVLGEAQSGSADAVISIRFEPDETCLGAVFAYVHDRAGKFLWQGHVGCRSLPGDDQSMMFKDASSRLLAKFESTIKAAQQRASETPGEQLVTEQ